MGGVGLAAALRWRNSPSCVGSACSARRASILFNLKEGALIGVTVHQGKGFTAIVERKVLLAEEYCTKKGGGVCNSETEEMVGAPLALEYFTLLSRVNR